MTSASQPPRAAKGLVCPLHKKDMSQVCHKCPMWLHIRGMDKNTGEEVDHWNCSIAQLPMLLIEVSSTVRGVNGSVDHLRKENLAVGQVIGAAIDEASKRALTSERPEMKTIENASWKPVE